MSVLVLVVKKTHTHILASYECVSERIKDILLNL